MANNEIKTLISLILSILKWTEKSLFSRYIIIYLMNIIVVKRMRKYYTRTKIKPINESKFVVYMANGIIRHGGLSDRFRGIISVFKLCQQVGVEFKIYWTSPYKLQDYLVPNEYNWMISENEICYNTKYVRPYFITSTSNTGDEEVQYYYAKKYLRGKYKQIHFYTNMYIGDNEYGVLFKRLFRPTIELQNIINFNLGNTGTDYIAIVFRFQRLLGDFNEKNYPELDDNNKRELINRCIDHIKEIRLENTHNKIVITSDSISFLKEAANLDFVYIISGNIVHIDYVSNFVDKQTHMKSYIDYYMLSKAKKIYLVVDGQMYNSGFAYRAALYSDIPYFVKMYNSK